LGPSDGLGLNPIAREVLSLQASAGNRSVAALLGRDASGRPTAAPGPPAVQRQGEDVALLPAGNPLVGLKRGDGLVFGTFDRRTRVRQLQQKLNEKIVAGLAEDGMFGPLTAEALANFQASVGLPVEQPVSPDTADALLDRPAAAGGIAGVPAGSEGTVRAAVIEAGTKLFQAKLPYEIAASSIRQAGADIGVSQRTNGIAVGANLRIAGDAIASAGTFIASAGAKMVAGGPTTGAFPLPGGNPLVGLQNGDGLRFGTESLRPRVVQLQERLNERMTAELKIDGMFGPKTKLALNEFQRSIRVPETDVVDQVTGDALLTGEIGQAVAVPGGADLEIAGQKFEEAAVFMRTAATLLQDPFSDTDLRAGQSLEVAGTGLAQSGGLVGQAGTRFRTGRTKDETEAGGSLLASSGTTHAIIASGLRDAGLQVTFGSGVADQSAGGNLTAAGNFFDVAAKAHVDAGADIIRAAEVMTPAA
jgi:peptidoglycan hydrolase-like protein with peptidoglycan-binding domain